MYPAGQFLQTEFPGDRPSLVSVDQDPFVCDVQGLIEDLVPTMTKRLQLNGLGKHATRRHRWMRPDPVYRDHSQIRWSDSGNELECGQRPDGVLVWALARSEMNVEQVALSFHFCARDVVMRFSTQSSTSVLIQPTERAPSETC